MGNHSKEIEGHGEVLHAPQSWSSKDYDLAVGQYLRKQLEPLFISNISLLFHISVNIEFEHTENAWNG